MKKTTIWTTMFTLLLCMQSCEKAGIPNSEDNESANLRNVQFVIKNLDVEYGASRATLTSESITDLYVWEGSTLLAHQTSTDDNFGSPTIYLTVGAHDLTFVASKADGQGWADGVWSCNKVKDTYGTVLAYTVSSSSTSKQVQLTRCNGKVMWTIEDAIPADAQTANVSVTQCMGLDASLNGVSKQTYTNGITLTSVVGTTGITISAMVLPESHADGMVCTAAINIINTSGSSLCQYSNDVTVKPNEICNIHGTFFSGSNQALASIVTDWGTTTNYDIR